MSKAARKTRRHKVAAPVVDGEPAYLIYKRFYLEKWGQK